jgi:hypothetical protein
MKIILLNKHKSYHTRFYIIAKIKYLKSWNCDNLFLIIKYDAVLKY